MRLFPRFTGFAAAAVLAASVALPVLPASSEDAPPTFAYTTVGTKGGCELATIDLTTAAATSLGAGADDDACVVDLTVAPDGVVWGIGQMLDDDMIEVPGTAPAAVTPSIVQLVKFDPATGTLDDVVPVTVGAEVLDIVNGGITVTTDGTVWIQLVSKSCASGGAVCLYTVDPATGVATEVGSSDLEETPLYGLSVCGSEVVTLVGGRDEVSQRVGTVDPADGSVNPGPATTGLTLGYDCGGRDTGYALNIAFGAAVDAEPTPQAGILNLTTFDPTTGTLEVIAAVTAVADEGPLALPPADAPEPTPPPTSTPAPAPAPAAQAAAATPRFTG